MLSYLEDSYEYSSLEKNILTGIYAFLLKTNYTLWFNSL